MKHQIPLGSLLCILIFIKYEAGHASLKALVAYRDICCIAIAIYAVPVCLVDCKSYYSKAKRLYICTCVNIYVETVLNLRMRFLYEPTVTATATNYKTLPFTYTNRPSHHIHFWLKCIFWSQFVSIFYDLNFIYAFNQVHQKLLLLLNKCRCKTSTPNTAHDADVFFLDTRALHEY